jgi:hypothetical protein
MSPNEAIERVREASDIVRIIGGYVALRKAGPRHTGLCPFHHEKTPSFSVDPNRRRFHCFGCGTDGDLFTFIQRIESVDFRGAICRLAQLAGIALQPDHELAPEDAMRWAAERRAFERDLGTPEKPGPARLWRRTAAEMAEDLLATLKAGLFDPPPERSHPKVGEVAEWTRRLTRWRAIDAAELVNEYREWRECRPQLTSAMVRSAALQQTADRRALDRYWLLTEDEAA